ncbi:MAG: phage major tail tube protein, partial [Pseudomonas balearica]
CTYYKLSVDGNVEIEIDLLNFVFMVNGEDRLAEHRKAIGL